jgi:antitoxin component HigA of HigAB toxin-antitoxin module
MKKSRSALLPKQFMHIISYRRLREYAQKHTEVENEEALTIVEQLMHLQDRTPEQDAIYELLVVLIERFEQEFYNPNVESNSGSMLDFLMDRRDLQPIDLVTIFGNVCVLTFNTSDLNNVVSDI